MSLFVLSEYHNPKADDSPPQRLQIFSQTGTKIYDAVSNNSSSEVLYLHENAKEKIDVQLDELQKQRQDLNNETQRRLNELNSAY